MCGIAGYWALGAGASEQAETLKRMAATLGHRGPDDEGVWFDADAGIGLAHRRLAILDLSPAGHQPMVSSSGRFVLVFNGEIYNHLDLRGELEGRALYPDLSPGGGGKIPWRGHSDTETLLAGFESWGIEATLKRAIGMFAIAAWDRAGRTLSLARDRMGEKPLYYGWQGGAFLFGSELKALKAHPAFKAEIDRDALSLFLRHNCIPTPYTIYRRIHKLPPGALLTLPSNSAMHLPDAAPVPYWSLREVAEHGQGQPFQGNDREAVAALDDLLRDVVRRQQLADVPLGAFLSGGVDSSTVGRGADAGASQSAGQNFYHRFSRVRLRRSAPRPGRRPPSRHRPYRTVGDPGRGASSHSPPAGDLRRTVCRRLPDSDFSGGPTHPPPRHGFPVGRWRRRVIRRL